MAQDPLFKAKTMYAYVDTPEGKRLAGNVRIIYKAQAIQEKRTGLTTWDHTTQKYIQFKGGMYICKNQEELAFLENYNKNNPRAKFTIDDKKIKTTGGVEQTEVIREKIVIPATVLAGMDPLAIRRLMQEQFGGYEAEGETAVELIEEGRRQGFFV